MKAYRRVWAAAVALLVVVGIGASGLGSARVTHGLAPAEDLVVRLANGDDLAALAAAHGLDPDPIDRLYGTTIFLVRITDGSDADAKAAELLLDRRVLYAEPNQLAQMPEGSSISPWAVSISPWAVGNPGPALTGQWAMGAVGLPSDHHTGGAGVVVAVLDTGIDLAHPAFAGRLVPGWDFVDNDAVPAEETAVSANPAANEGFGHGTHVSGIVSLVAPEAKLMPVRVLDSDGGGTIWALAQGLAFASANGADVINLSMTFDVRSGLISDVTRAVTCEPVHKSADLPCFDPRGRGAVVAVAAGNQGSREAVFPAGSGAFGQISVGATVPGGQRAVFSNYGSWVDLGAPGEAILSTVPGGYGTWAGTSMAAPFVSGTAALIRAKVPTLNPGKVVKRIEDSAIDVEDSDIQFQLSVPNALLGAK